MQQPPPGGYMPPRPGFPPPMYPGMMPPGMMPPPGMMHPGMMPPPGALHPAISLQMLSGYTFGPGHCTSLSG